MQVLEAFTKKNARNETEMISQVGVPSNSNTIIRLISLHILNTLLNFFFFGFFFFGFFFFGWQLVCLSAASYQLLLKGTSSTLSRLSVYVVFQLPEHFWATSSSARERICQEHLPRPVQVMFLIKDYVDDVLVVCCAEESLPRLDSREEKNSGIGLPVLFRHVKKPKKLSCLTKEDVTWSVKSCVLTNQYLLD
jgi:hypothetical protein